MTINDEQWVADRIRQVARDHLGRELGEPELHDDGSMDRMFDVIFRSSIPPVALEVTSITDVVFEETAHVGYQVAARLSRMAVSAASGEWLVEVDKSVRVREVQAWLTPIVLGHNREWSESPRPHGVFGVTHDRNGPHDVRFGTWSSSTPSATRPLHPAEILARLEAKRETLSLAHGHERHLAVHLKALRSHEVPPPVRLPPEIDWLWVVWFGGQLVAWTTGGGWGSTPWP